MKWYGLIGYSETVKVKPGVYESVMTYKPYFGDMLRFISRRNGQSQINDNLDVNNSIF